MLRVCAASKESGAKFGALQIRKTAEKLLLSKLKAQVLEEEKASREVQRGPKPVGRLQHAAIAASQKPSQTGARESKCSYSSTGADETGGAPTSKGHVSRVGPSSATACQ
jgi:hypothetical protein